MEQLDGNACVVEFSNDGGRAYDIVASSYADLSVGLRFISAVLPGWHALLLEQRSEPFAALAAGPDAGAYCFHGTIGRVPCRRRRSNAYAGVSCPVRVGLSYIWVHQSGGISFSSLSLP